MTEFVLAEYLDCERERAQLRNDNERLALALAEYTARAERTISALYEENARLRLLNGRKETTDAMAR